MSTPNHPSVTSSTSSSVLESSGHCSEAASSAISDTSRPHAPVAKTLNEQDELKHDMPSSPNNNGEVIPNLLHSGKFPPPSRSPRHAANHSHSPPPIMNSPIYPSAPPCTPHSPATKMGLSLLSSGYKLDPRPSQIPSLNQDDHYHKLLNEYQSKALFEEKSRVESVKEHEEQYSTLEEYKHALARERRHSYALVQELSYYKFNSRYQTCQLYSEAEMNEEAKVNLLIKNMEGIIKEKDEDKVRTVMELEREEERMINVLMGRLEAVNREKGILERQIYGFGDSSNLSSAGRQSDEVIHGTTGRFENMEGVELVVSGQTMLQQQSKNEVTGRQEFEIKLNDNNGIMECDGEAGEIDGDQDILEDKSHDEEMEQELDNLLQKKDIDK